MFVCGYDLSFDGWRNTTFAIDRKVIEERNIVREKGSIDYVFIIIVFVMIAFGTVMVYSASYAYSMNTYGDSYYIIFRQIIFAVVGLVAMAFAAWFRPEWYRKLSVWIYLFCFLLSRVGLRASFPYRDFLRL